MNSIVVDKENKSSNDISMIVLHLLLILSSFKNIEIIISLIIIYFILKNLNDNLYKLMPMFIFFYSKLVLPYGIVVFRIYSITYVIYRLCKGINIKYKLNIYIFLTIYYLFVVIRLKVSIGLSLIFDLTFIFFYFTEINRDIIKKRNFFKFYVISSFSAVIYGIFNKNLMGLTIYANGDIVELSRFLATFNDPNYVGLFINISIVILLITNIFKNSFIKKIMLITFYLALIATMSMTALICNFLFISILLFLKFNIKKVLIYFLMLFCAINIYNISLQNDMGFISKFSLRIEDKLKMSEKGDFNYLTSNRDVIWENNIQYYLNQNNFKKLIGFNFISDYGIDKNFKHVSHQFYIDLLINFGLIGTVIFLFFIILDIVNKIINYRKEGSDFYLAEIFIKVLWLFYGLSLSMFPGWYFIIFIFL